MEISITSSKLANQHTGCTMIAIFKNSELSLAAKILDDASNGYISKILELGDLKGDIGQTLLLHDIPNVPSQRILLVNAGENRPVDERTFIKIVECAFQAIIQRGAQSLIACLHQIVVKERDNAWKIRQLALIYQNQFDKCDQLKSKKKDHTEQENLKPAHLAIYVPKADSDMAQQAITESKAIAAGMTLCKYLGNLPANHCTPTDLAEQAKQLAKQFKPISTRVLEEKDMQKLGMGALLAVSQGSDQPAKLITIEYKGSKKGEKPVVLVGKGITFDSGGISLKPGPGMDEMKYDMLGAASVLGTLTAVAELDLPVNIIGVIATTENLPSGRAYKPGDIITSMSGQTIEVLNTDAEGRMILCDALTYVSQFDPAVVIDIATLTGAVITALGHHANGLMSNHQPLADDLLKAGHDSFDRAWQLPLWEEYNAQIDSPFADMANIGGKSAGSITAGCFLSRFAKDYHWAHLDIAGTGWPLGKIKSASGRPVPLLTQYIINRCRGQ